MASEAWSRVMREFGTSRSLAQGLGLRSGTLSWAYGLVPAHQVAPLRCLLQQVGLEREIEVVLLSDSQGELRLRGVRDGR